MRKGLKMKGICLAIAALLLTPGGVVAAEKTGEFNPTPTTVLVQEQLIDNGIITRTFSGRTVDDKPLLVNVLNVDTSLPGAGLSLAVPGGGVTSREKLSSMAADNGAIAAVNGGFYVSGGSLSYPVGHLVENGRPLSKWNVWRTSMALTTAGVLFGNFQPELQLTFPGGQLVQVDKVNYPPEKEEATLYTAAWGTKQLPPGGNGYWLGLEKIEEGVIINSISDRAAMPSGEAMQLFLPRQKMPAGAAVGDYLKMDYTYPDFWGQIEELVTGGPLLVEDGGPVFEAAAEGFDGSILQRNPRTAVALDRQGHLLLVTVDGRSANSAGLTLEEFSLLLVSLGAREAMGLDGGGSTEMWLNGSVVNTPSDGAERLLPNAILISSGIPVWLNDQRLYFDVQPVVMQGRTLVPLRGLFEALGTSVSWDEAAQSAVIDSGRLSFRLPIGSKSVLINQSEYQLDVPAQLVRGRTMVPLRFIMESLGASVQWIEDKGWVKIYVD